MMKHIFKHFLILILALQLSFGAALPSVYAQEAPNDSKEVVLGNSYKQAPWPLSILSELEESKNHPEVQAQIEKFEAGVQAMEEGRFQDLPQHKRDVFRLSGQRFEILKKGEIVETYPLDRLNIELPFIAYDALEIVTGGSDLIINAINAGDVVARHVIPKMNPAASTMDKELLYIMDQKGSIHAIDMVFAKTKGLFQAPIPVYANLWTPLKPLNLEGELQLTFQTRGLEPFEEMDPSHPRHAEVVLPKDIVDSTEEIIFSAGDLVAYTQTDTGRNLIGVFSRSVTHQQIARGNIVLSWLGFIANPSEVPQETLENILREIQAEELNADVENVQGSLSPLTRHALNAFNQDAIQAFVERGKANAELQARQVDQMTLESWSKSFQALKQKAQSVIDTGNAKEDAAFLKAQLEAQDMGSSWMDLSNPKWMAAKLNPKSVQNKFQKYMPSRRALKVLGSIAAGMGFVKASYALEITPIINAVNYFYANILPQNNVLQDSAYLFPALFVSSVALLAIIPLADMVSDASVPVLKKLASLMKKLPGQKAQKVGRWLDERVKVWEPLNTWQRMISFNMRPFAKLMYPFWHWFTKHILRQPHFLASLRAGINPFAINPNQPSAGRVGINFPTLPFLKSGTTQNKRSALSDLAEHQKRANTLAQNLALLTVSEESGVDPATLLMVLSGKIKPENIQRILDDPELSQEWKHSTEALATVVASLNPNQANVLLENADPQAVIPVYEEIRAAADVLKNRSELKTILHTCKDRFINISMGILKNLAWFGLQDHELLSKGFATKDIARQVEMEFKQDHQFMVGYSGVHGPMANLDDPKNLAADPDGFLYIRTKQAYRMVLNTYAHLFSSGSRLMLVYFKKPPVLETNYTPEINTSLPISEVHESFLKGALNWWISLLDFRTSDLGGIFMRSLDKQVKTLQAGFIMSFVLLMCIAHKTPLEAVRSWYMQLTGSMIYIGWVWYITQAANLPDAPRVRNKLKNMKDHLVLLPTGIELQDPQLLEEGRTGLLELYEKNNTLSKEQRVQLETMDAQSLMAHVAAHPPFPTARHPYIPKIATWGAVGLSTFLAIHLTVKSLSSDELTNEALILWTGYWLAFPAV